jgi:hypothetical protein
MTKLSKERIILVLSTRKRRRRKGHIERGSEQKKFEKYGFLLPYHIESYIRTRQNEGEKAISRRRRTQPLMSQEPVLMSGR